MINLVHMRTNRAIAAAAAALTIAVTLPLAVLAQDDGPMTSPQPAGMSHHDGGPPGGHHHHWSKEQGDAMMLKEFHKLGLSDSQISQITTNTVNFRAAHPMGQRPTPEEMKAHRDAILAIMTPEQRAQFMNDMRKWRRKHHHGHSGMHRPMNRITPTPTDTENP